MARQKGIITLKGKLGGLVYTEGKHGRGVRSLPTLTEEQRKAKAALPQNTRSAMLNAVASTINDTVAHYAGPLKDGKFYSNMQSCFRKERSEHRSVVLRSIQQLEINERYKFGKVCPRPYVTMTLKKGAYILDADISAPSEEYHEYNTVSFEFILIVFERGSNECRHEVRYSSWLRIGEDGTKYITLEYPRTRKDTDYLVACRGVFAKNEIEDGRWTSAAMCFLTGGAITRDGMKQLAAHDAARKAETVSVKKEAVEKVRVEVRGEK